MGDGETTGLLTGIERNTLEGMRQHCVDLAEALRASAETIDGGLVPLTEEAAMSEWISSARLTYDLGRSALGIALGLVALACGSAASHYDDAVWLLEQQLRVEFP